MAPISCSCFLCEFAELNTGFARHLYLFYTVKISYSYNHGSYFGNFGRHGLCLWFKFCIWVGDSLFDSDSVDDREEVEEGRISTFLLCAWSRGLEGEARPILPAPPRALAAGVHGACSCRSWWQWSWWSKTLQQSLVGILFYQNNKYIFVTAEESIISITWSW